MMERSSKNAIKALTSRIKNFTAYLERTRRYNISYKENDFEMAAEIKNKSGLKDINPHSYWTREIIWLILLFLYD